MPRIGIPFKAETDMTIQKERCLNRLDCAASPAGAVNVLDLGVRNDGTEDVSAIVNRHTADHALFFPAGVYRVAAPIFAKNPLFGEGYAR